MKKLFFLLPIIFSLLLSCNDGDDFGISETEPVQLKIKSYTSTSLISENITTYYFNEDGNITKWTSQIPSFGELERNYTYNDLGNIIEKRGLLNNGNTRSYKYYYNADDKIERFDLYSQNGSSPYPYTLTHTPNSIAINWASPGHSKKIDFDADGRIEHTHFTYDFGNYADEDLEYDAKNNIIEIQRSGPGGSFNNFIYEYETKRNPLYSQFHKNYFTYAFADGLYLNYESLFFSPYLISKIIYETNKFGGEDHVVTHKYQYNYDGYPLTLERRKNDTLLSTAIFEYY